MDENCPNSATPPYDRVVVPYQRFIKEQDVSGRVDVVEAAVNARYNMHNNYVLLTPTSNFSKIHSYQ